MGKMLSEILLANGFLMVLGTKEKSMREFEIVGYGTPYTFDSTQGYTVVYDEQGRPWWTKSSNGLFEGLEFSEVADGMYWQGKALKRGAYVPHTDTLYLTNLVLASRELKKRLLAMGAKAPVQQVIAAWRYEFGNLGSFAAKDLPAVCERLQVHTIGELMSFDDASIAGPQAQYAGNKTLGWLKAIEGAFYEGSKTVFPSRVRAPGG